MKASPPGKNGTTFGQYDCIGQLAIKDCKPYERTIFDQKEGQSLEL